MTEGRLVDIVADGFDFGVRMADLVPTDMIAIPLAKPQPAADAASRTSSGMTDKRTRRLARRPSDEFRDGANVDAPSASEQAAPACWSSR